SIETGSLVRAGRIVLDDDDLEFLKALYDGGLRTSDDEIGGLLEHLRTLGLYDRTLVVITSDHGEELGDHLRPYSGNHGHSLYDELLHLPLLIHDAVASFAPRHVPSPVRTIDVLPTMADLLGAPLLTPTDGRSLRAVLDGSEHGARPAWGGRTKY